MSPMPGTSGLCCTTSSRVEDSRPSICVCRLSRGRVTQIMSVIITLDHSTTMSVYHRRQLRSRPMSQQSNRRQLQRMHPNPPQHQVTSLENQLPRRLMSVAMGSASQLKYQLLHRLISPPQ